MRHPLTAVLLAALMLAPAAAGAQSGTDIIRLKSSEERKGKVIRVTHQEVAYTMQGGGDKGELGESLDNVSDIVFYDTPLPLSKGESELKAGKPAAALQQFQNALDQIQQGKCRGFHKQYALFGIARAHEENGDLGEAVAAFRKLIDGVPDTRFKREAYERALDCAQRKKDARALDDLLEKMRKEPGEMGRSLASRAELTAAWGLLQTGKVSEARERFDKLSRVPDAAVQANAQVGVIRCLAAEKKFDDLRRLCEGVVRGANDDPGLMAAAYAGLGDLIFDRAIEGKDPAPYRDALWPYLRVVVRYMPARGQPTEDYERALYRAAKCFEKLRDGAQKPEAKKEHQERALGLYDELARDFKGSEWATKAQRDITALKR